MVPLPCLQLVLGTNGARLKKVPKMAPGFFLDFDLSHSPRAELCDRVDGPVQSSVTSTHPPSFISLAQLVGAREKIRLGDTYHISQYWLVGPPPCYIVTVSIFSNCYYIVIFPYMVTVTMYSNILGDFVLWSGLLLYYTGSTKKMSHRHFSLF